MRHHNTIRPFVACIFKIGFVMLTLWGLGGAATGAWAIQTNATSQAILADASTGLVATTLSNYSYTYAARNTTAIQNAIGYLQAGQTLLLPAGVYDVQTITIDSMDQIGIAGQGRTATTLRRKGFYWNNNTQGDCTTLTEILRVTSSHGFTLQDLTLNGNGHHIGLCGYGGFNSSTRKISWGTPQFPVFGDGQGGTLASGNIIYIALSDLVEIDSVGFDHGFRWALSLVKINGLSFHDNVISTGNLSTDFKGHYDPSPNNTVMHAHTSQDGLHMTNVSNAVIEYNDIHSEDSAIAVELNPAYTWGGHNTVENIQIGYNYIRTNSPTDAAVLLNDSDVIYGTGLANSWTGLGAVDIFYNEVWDASGSVTVDKGERGLFKNIQVYANAIEKARYGVRCGFFIGAGTYHCDKYNHRIDGLTVRDHTADFMAGPGRDHAAGIRLINKSTGATYNNSGGVGISVRNTDAVTIENNLIEDITGGLGIELVRTTQFKVQGNIIDDVSGTSLADGVFFTTYDAGEGIRVWNDTSLTADPRNVAGYYDAGWFAIEGNRIGAVAASKIGIFYTQNGRVSLAGNYDLSGTPLTAVGGALTTSGCANIDTAACYAIAQPGSMLFSDTFDSVAAWTALGGQSLNNAMGGSQAVQYIAWNGHHANPDYDRAVTGSSGTRCSCLTWGGVAIVTGCTTSASQGYTLTCDIHPPSGLDSAGDNLYGGLKILSSATASLTDTSGVKVLLSGSGTAGTDGSGSGAPGSSPYRLWVAYHNASGAVTRELGTISASDYDGWWVRLGVEFIGSGTAADPLELAVLINDGVRERLSITDLASAGTRNVGLVAYQASQNFFGAFTQVDNLNLSTFEPRQPVRPAAGTMAVSDTYDSVSAWGSLASQSMNNALGGSGSGSYINWNGQFAHPGYNRDEPGEGGDRSACLTWGGVAIVSGAQTSQNDITMIQCDLIPPKGVDSNGDNLWGGLKILSANDAYLHAANGLRVTVRGDGSAGTDGAGTGAPGSAPGEIYVTYYNAQGSWTSESIGQARASEYASGWLRLGLQFEGAGTAADPLALRVFMNQSLVKALSVSDLASAGSYWGACAFQDSKGFTQAFTFVDNLKMWRTPRRGRAVQNVTATVLSDTFDSVAGWSWLNNQALNNALGGTAAVAHVASDGQFAHPDWDYPALGAAGVRANCITWNMAGMVEGYQLDLTKHYVLACDLHPSASLDASGNNSWAGLKLLASDATSIWDSTGVRVLVSGTGSLGTDGLGSGAPGAAPNVISVRYYNASGEVTVNLGTVASSEYDYYDQWIRLSVEASGAGTSTQPLELAVFINERLVGELTITDLASYGTRQVGMISFTGHSSDYGYVDNLTLGEWTP